MIVPRRTRAWSSEESLVAAGESKRSAFVMQSMTQRLPFDWSDLFIIKREAALINEVERKLPNAEYSTDRLPKFTDVQKKFIKGY
jgi:hypothetical protein